MTKTWPGFAVSICLTAFVALAWCGCGSKNAVSIGTSHADAFKSAPPEVKAAWDSAMDAMKTNGYATAIMSLRAVRSLPGITPDQGKAIDQTATAISDQMYEAANKDDPAAKQAIEDLRRLQAR